MSTERFVTALKPPGRKKGVLVLPNQLLFLRVWDSTQRRRRFRSTHGFTQNILLHNIHIYTSIYLPKTEYPHIFRHVILYVIHPQCINEIVQSSFLLVFVYTVCRIQYYNNFIRWRIKRADGPCVILYRSIYLCIILWRLHYNNNWI